MIAAFAFKMVFFGAYVAVMIRVVALRPVPFVASFTGYLRRAVSDGSAVFAPVRYFDDAAGTRVEHADRPGAAEKFNAGEIIIEHVSNSGLDHPLIHLPKIFGIDFSVTKHVFMLWLVAAFVFIVGHAGRCGGT